MMWWNKWKRAVSVVLALGAVAVAGVLSRGPAAEPTAPPASTKSGQVAKRRELVSPAEVPKLIKAATTRPWPGENYPVLPALSTEMEGGIANEIVGSKAVRAAYTKLDANERNVTWFDGVAELEKAKAVLCLQSCLCHPSPDVQIHVLRSLERLKDKRAVPFLVLYAEYMAVWVDGSENATIHGIIHRSVARTLSSLTGVRVTLKDHRQDPEGLRKGIRLWRKWQCEYS